MEFLMFIYIFLLLFFLTISPAGICVLSLFKMDNLKYNQKYSILTVKYCYLNLLGYIIGIIINLFFGLNLIQIFLLNILTFLFYYFVFYKMSLKRVEQDHLLNYVDKKIQPSNISNTIPLSENSKNENTNNIYWNLDLDNIQNQFLKFNSNKYYRTDVELLAGEVGIAQLKKDVYNNIPIEVKSLEDIYILLFLTFGRYKDNWDIISLSSSQQLNLTIKRINKENDKKCTFLKI